MHSLKLVPVEAFEINFRSESSRKDFSFLGNFVYEQGAYRYVGKGAFPFWSTPDTSDPCKKKCEQLGSKDEPGTAVV